MTGGDVQNDWGDGEEFSGWCELHAVVQLFPMCQEPGFALVWGLKRSAFHCMHEDIHPLEDTDIQGMSPSLNGEWQSTKTRQTHFKVANGVPGTEGSCCSTAMCLFGYVSFSFKKREFILPWSRVAQLVEQGTCSARVMGDQYGEEGKKVWKVCTND